VSFGVADSKIVEKNPIATLTNTIVA